MKKLICIMAVMTAGLLFAASNGVSAQSITYTPIYNISEKMPNTPLAHSTGPVINPNHVIDPSVNIYVVKIKPNSQIESWNGNLPNWSKKKPKKRDM